MTLHRFSFSPVHKHIVHELLEVKDKDRFGPVDGELDKLKKLGWGDVRTNPTCNLYWKWNLNHFKGQTLPGMCVTDSPSERPIIIEASGELWNDRMVRNDRNYRLDGSLIGRPGGDTPILFERLD